MPLKYNLIALKMSDFTVSDPTFLWRAADVLFHQFGDLIVQHHGIQGPAFVSPGDLLSHGCQETCWVEEPGHPETVRSALKQPAVELGVTVQQVSEPETKSGRLPGDLDNRK